MLREPSNEDYFKAMREQDKAYILAVYRCHPELAPPEVFIPEPYPTPEVKLTIRGDMKMREVAMQVAKKHGITMQAILGQSKYTKYVRARWEAFWICSLQLGRSSAAIGRAFNRDHATVLHGIKKHNERLLAECNNS